jgi:hypothetical protein
MHPYVCVCVCVYVYVTGLFTSTHICMSQGSSPSSVTLLGVPLGVCMYVMEKVKICLAYVYPCVCVCVYVPVKSFQYVSVFKKVCLCTHV